MKRHAACVIDAHANTHAAVTGCDGWPGDATSSQKASEYPLTLPLDVQATAGATTITSVLTINVEQAMPAFRRTKLIDALKIGGYPEFLKTLRSLPPIGSIKTEKREVELKYLNEETTSTGRRLVLVADRPLFFLNRDTDKKKAGYELTMVELRFDEAGGVTGTITGAAKVRPSPQGDGGVVLDDYDEAPVQLKGKVGG
jgi:hypothetical protein